MEGDRRGLGREQTVDRTGVLQLPEGCEGQGKVEVTVECNRKLSVVPQWSLRVMGQGEGELIWKGEVEQ